MRAHAQLFELTRRRSIYLHSEHGNGVAAALPGASRWDWGLGLTDQTGQTIQTDQTDQTDLAQ